MYALSLGISLKAKQIKLNLCFPFHELLWQDFIKSRNKLILLFYTPWKQGTDGSVFPPLLGKSSVLKIYNKDMCRSLPLEFNKMVTHFNMETFR